MSKRSRKVAFSKEVLIADKRRREDGQADYEEDEDKSEGGAHKLG